jgi:SAM-dependent methyltransferase
MMTSTAAASGASYFDEAEFAAREHLEDSHYWHLHRRQVLLRELRAFQPAEQCGPLIELGCGIGTVATFLNENGYAVDYADYFASALAIAERRARARLGPGFTARTFSRVDVTAPLALERRYSGMMMFDVIEHLPDDAAVLANVRDALEPGGFVMLTVPAFQALWSPWDDMEKHKRRYTRGSLERVLSAGGFEVRRSTYFFAPLFFAAAAMKAVRVARRRFFGEKPAAHIGELAEAKNVEALNRIMLSVLGPERALLGATRLPLGTSVLAIATRRQ